MDVRTHAPFALLVAAITVGLGPQTTGRGPSSRQGGPGVVPPQGGSGLVLGEVVDATTRRPVPYASVSLWSPRSGAQKAIEDSVDADAGGRFVLADISQGPHTIGASVPGYLPADADASGALTLDLDHGQRVGNAVVKLTRGAAIGGRVIDEFGEPVVGVDVQSRWLGGSSAVGAGAQGFARTDDRGRYLIRGQPPGDYLIVIPTSYVTFGNQLPAFLSVLGGGPSATALGSSMSATGSFYAEGAEVQPWGALARSVPPPTAGQRLRVYPSTFCPGTDSPQRASVIALTAGAERLDADIQLRLVATRRVSGRLTGPNGPIGNELVQLIPDGGTAITGLSGATDPQGRFTILGVASGQYTMKAAQHWPPSAVPLSVSMALRVGAADIDGVHLIVRPGTEPQ